MVSFTFNGIRETLSYVPVEGTDWLLTYLIRESLISDSISAISDGIIRRSVIQSMLTVVVLLVFFVFIIRQTRKNAQLALEKETADAENRLKQAELFMATLKKLPEGEQIESTELFMALVDKVIVGEGLTFVLRDGSEKVLTGV